MKSFREGVAPINNEIVKNGDYILHGDVIIERIDNMPSDFDNLEKSQTNDLAIGEATNHFHRLFGEGFALRIDPDNKNNRYLRVVKPVVLKHQEHLPIVLPPGDYRTRIQKEYDPFTKKISEVAD